MEISPDHHDCSWRLKAEELSRRVEELCRRIEQLERMLFGKRSERISTTKNTIISESAAVQETRALRRKSKTLLPEVRHSYEVKEEAKLCPICGSCDLKKIGDGKISSLIEYVPARLERHVHVQEPLACSCGEYIVTADGPIKPVEGGHYGASLMAHTVVAKCVDS